MSQSQRIVFGHAVMNLGLALRRLSLVLCLLAGLVLGAWSLLEAAGSGGGLPTVIRLHELGPAGWTLVAILAVVALLLTLRLLAVAIGAVGWSVLPTEHRDVLSRLSATASPSGERNGLP